MNDTNLLENQPIAWTPTEEVKERAQLTKFMKQVGVSTFDELYQFSIDDVEKFTAEVLRFLDIKFDPPYKKLLDLSDGVEFPNWLSGAGLNITEMCLDRWQTDEMKDQPAVIWEGEEGEIEKITYKELIEQVELCAAGLRANDLGKGDAIGIHLPMMIETVVALLAINRIGAIAVPVFSGYGVEAIASRMNAVKAKGLITCDGFHRRGRLINTTRTAFEAAERCPTIEKLIPVSSAGKESRMKFHRTMSRFLYAMHSLYPNIDLHEVRRLQSSISQNINFGRMKEFFQSRDLSIDPQDLFERLKKVARTASEKDRPQLPFEQIVKQYREEGINVKLEDLEKAFSLQNPYIFYYKETIEALEEKGYKIDRSLIEKEMGKDPPKPTKNPQTAGTGADLVKLETTSKYSFEIIPWGWLLNPHSHKSERNKIEKTLAEDPLIILYTSGTTGKPKGIAHTHASFPIKAAQDMAFGTDVGVGTRISWLTDIGWMMGPWLIYGALINGATICIYDGAPDFPTADRMWEFAAKHKVEILGISPTLIRSLATHGDELPKKHDLSALRAFASTGEPWNPAPWWWLFEKVGDSKLPIINYSGGTEISGGILMNNFLTPIKPCGFSAPCPGMDVDILDEEGNPVGANQVGELVIKKPWIGMARGFWKERERYLETYWSRFENIWVHGDFAMRDADGHYFILGRSDDTLKVAGKRVGPAEVESLLVAHENVAEAAVIGIPDEIKGTKMIAFVVLNKKTNEDLEKELKALIAKDMGKPLAPSKIHFVSALPKTRNAKVMRRVIRSAYLGEDAGDLSALENPQTVEEIAKIRQ